MLRGIKEAVGDDTTEMITAPYHPVEVGEQYVHRISADEKELIVINGCGHHVQYSLPEEFSDAVRRVLKQE